MTSLEWDAICERIAAIWPSRPLRKPTIEAWYAEFAREADYDAVMLAVSRLAEGTGSAPSLAVIMVEYRRIKPPAARYVAPDHSPAEEEHWRVIGREWELIQWCMHDARISGMRRALVAQLLDPENPTEEEAANLRLALVAEIEALQIEPIEPPLLGS